MAEIDDLKSSITSQEKIVEVGIMMKDLSSSIQLLKANDELGYVEANSLFIQSMQGVDKVHHIRGYEGHKHGLKGHRTIVSLYMPFPRTPRLIKFFPDLKWIREPSWISGPLFCLGACITWVGSNGSSLSCPLDSDDTEDARSRIAAIEIPKIRNRITDGVVPILHGLELRQLTNQIVNFINYP